jgi:AcrR family transcriptional regulator
MSTAEQGNRSRSGLRRTLVTSELLDTATRLFAEKGYEATSLLDIAKALDISRPALYNYVSSKDDLLGMLVEQVTNGFAEVLAQLKARDDLTPSEKVADVVGLIVRQRAEHPDQFRILDRSEPILSEPLAGAHLAAKRTILREFTTLIEAGIETGEFRRVDARTTALSLLGMCNWVAWWFRPGADVDAVAATITGLAAAMLAAGKPTGRNRQDSQTISKIHELLDRLDR